MNAPMTEHGPSTVSTSTTVTGTPDEACPYCDTTTGVRQTSDTGRVQAWACDCCATEWAFTVIRPDSHAAVLLTDLETAAEEIGRLLWTLRRVIALSDDAPGLTDEQLRTGLLVLAERARR